MRSLIEQKKMRRFLRKFILFCLFLAAVFAAPVGIKRLTGGFQVRKMEFDFPYQGSSEKEMSLEIRTVLKQPFHYLDRGSQCYVFESEDKKSVIKFFRFDSKYKLYRAFANFLLLRGTPRENLKPKADLLFKACKLAYERVPKETGLLYIHLDKTSYGLPILKCKDAIGRSYFFPLDRYRFVIQKKAELLTHVLERHFKSGNEEEISQCVDSLFKLIRSRTAKAIYNSDPNLSRNIGFLEGEAIEIDFGNYRDCSNLDLAVQQIRNTRRFYKQLRSWVKDRSPEWVSSIDERMKQFDEGR
jgi:hypothetical protein